MQEQIQNSKNITSRIGSHFSKEIEEIKDIRLKKGIDKKRKSTRKLTNLIVRHRAWERIKEDTIEVNLENE